MKWIWCFSFIFALSNLFSPSVAAGGDSFVTIVNPVRGGEFWPKDRSDNPLTAVLGQHQILDKYGLPATWLLRFDALNDQQMVDFFRQRSQNQEFGLFLEVIPSLAQAAGVDYNPSPSWHFANSVLLTGYSPQDRQKLIDHSFDEFNSVFGYFPKTIGAWWLDSFSLSYAKDKYQIEAVLIVADQYTTDNYQVWGQYWGAPYYPSKNNTLSPAQSPGAKIGVVMLQWAARDPFNGYGNGVFDSTFSVQANDYLSYHQLDTSYFEKLLDIYTSTERNEFGHLTIGLENDYSWQEYSREYANQIRAVDNRRGQGELRVVTAVDFANWYSKNFPAISPPHVIFTDDPLGGPGKVVWYMSPYYRAGWFFTDKGSAIRDLRQYNDSGGELCRDKACQTLNLATTVSKALDEVTFKQRWLFDEGKITDFQLFGDNGAVRLLYTNQSGKSRSIEFLQQDIVVDGTAKAISGAILDAITPKSGQAANQSNAFFSGNPQFSWWNMLWHFIWFVVIAYVVLFVPGHLLVKFSRLPLTGLEERVLSWVVGIVVATLTAYALGWLQARLLMAPLSIGWLLLFLKLYGASSLAPKWLFSHWKLLSLISVGTLLQSLTVVKSGLAYDFGLGFWGPNGHDAVWHLAVIGELINHFPPQNPLFSGELLRNYHYFYDLWLAQLAVLSGLNLSDLYFRFTPLLISALYGLSIFVLAKRLFQSNATAYLATFLGYFAGSFGFIISLIREKNFIGGESIFWANQPPTMLLNMPFALSAPLFFASLLLLFIVIKENRGWLLLGLVVGSAIEFKAYLGVLFLLALGITAVVGLVMTKKIGLVATWLAALILSVVVFLPNNSGSSSLFVFQPLWFIHNMLLAPDRVFWPRLDMAIVSGLETGNAIKLVTASLLGMVIFVVGNLGVRVLMIGTAIQGVKSLFERRTARTPAEYLVGIFLLVFVSAGLLAPLLFIQKGNPWNAIQFFYYVILISNVLAAKIIFDMLGKLGWARWLGYAVICLLAIPTTLSIFTTYLPARPPAYLSNQEQEALNFLAKQAPGVVMTYPFDEQAKSRFTEPKPLFAYETTGYVTAFTRQRTYLTDLMNAEITGLDVPSRLVGQREFFITRDRQWLEEFVTKNNIRYIYVRRDQPWKYDTSFYKMRQIFDNEEIIIFSII